MRLAALLILVMLAGCSKDPDPYVRPNNENSNNTENNDSRCRSDLDCETDYECNLSQEQCVPGACIDGKQSLGEAGVDCGGSCGGCADGTACTSPNDCASSVCAVGLCGSGIPNNSNNLPTCEDDGTPERFVVWDNTGLDDIVIEHDGVFAGAGPVVTSGIAVFDYNGDGAVDVMVSNQGGELALFQNDGAGNFTDVSGVANVTGLTRTTSLSAADFDGDGDVDVIVGRTNNAYVLVNDGAGAFTEASAVWGIGEDFDVVSGGSFADFDDDGDLDFYLALYQPVVGDDPFPPPLPNRLYRNDGTTFTEITRSPGSGGEAGQSLGVAWWDYNEDGRPDLWSSNDFGVVSTPNQLWRNDGPDPSDPNNWLFTEVGATVGIDVRIFGMSATLGDFDNDGDQDAYASNMINNVLHVMNNGVASEEAVARGVPSGTLSDPRPAPVDPPDYTPLITEMEAFMSDYADPNSGLYTLTSWASMFVDVNNDGHLDLFVANGAILSDITPEATNQPNRLYLNNGDGTFDQAPCWGFPDIRGTSRGAAYGDLDGDGDMDIIWAQNGDNGDAGIFVARNNMASSNWTHIELRGNSPNSDAIGAKITLSSAGGSQHRWVDGGQGFLGVSERVAHFGLGADAAITSLEITWPSGQVQTVNPAPPVNQRYVAVEP